MRKLTSFFRSKETRATELEVASVLFASVLGRRATEADLKAAAPGLTTADGLRDQVAAMISSPEFAIMRLPHLLAEAAKNYQGEKIFFLHVPKTAGTSLRLAFIEAMGIPALDRYNRTGTWDGYSEEFIKIWPLLVGHTNIYNFPQGTHRGVTVFREARARTLSLFRQSTRPAIKPKVHFGDEKISKVESNSRKWLDDFSGWLHKSRHPLDLLTWHVDLDLKIGLPHGDENGFNRMRQGLELEKHSQESIRHALERGLRRIEVAEWQHNRAGMDTLLSRALGREVRTSVPKVNQVLPEQAAKVIQLSVEDHQTLKRIAELSQVVFDIAADQGLIPRLSKDEADEQFEIAAGRLGFKL